MKLRSSLKVWASWAKPSRKARIGGALSGVGVSSTQTSRGTVKTAHQTATLRNEAFTASPAPDSPNHSGF